MKNDPESSDDGLDSTGNDDDEGCHDNYLFELDDDSNDVQNNLFSEEENMEAMERICLLYTSPRPRDS